MAHHGDSLKLRWLWNVQSFPAVRFSFLFAVDFPFVFTHCDVACHHNCTHTHIHTHRSRTKFTNFSQFCKWWRVSLVPLLLPHSLPFALPLALFLPAFSDQSIAFHFPATVSQNGARTILRHSGASGRREMKRARWLLICVINGFSASILSTFGNCSSAPAPFFLTHFL